MAIIKQLNNYYNEKGEEVRNLSLIIFEKGDNDTELRKNTSVGSIMQRDGSFYVNGGTTWNETKAIHFLKDFFKE